MTESEWLLCSDPRLMLDQVKQLASPRKLRWFACACVRAVWALLIDERSQHAVLIAEAYADNKASLAELAAAELAAFEVARIADLRTTVSDPAWAATRAAARAANLDAYSAASGAAFISALCAAPWSFDSSGGVVHHGDPSAKLLARQMQCEMLREILGNPYRVSKRNPAWSNWNGGIVPQLAQEIYEEQRYDELAVLADALEEAGCDDQEVLTHFRQQATHCRGCWALDLVLGWG